MGRHLRGNYWYLADRSTRLGRFDLWLRRAAEDGVPLFLAIIVPGTLLVMIAFAIGGAVSSANQPVPAPVTLTVINTSEMLETEKSYAESTDPTGRKVLLEGAWVEGDKVPAYPRPRDEAPDAAPLYSTSAPYNVVEGAIGWSLLGVLLGPIIMALLVTAYMVPRGRHYRKVNTSRSLVSAAYE